MPNPNKLKHQIIKKGVTQREMARDLDMDETYLSNMVNREINATESTLKKLADYLDCEITDII